MEYGTDVDPTGVIRHGQEVLELLEELQIGLEPVRSSFGESLAVGVSGLPEAAATARHHNALLQQVSGLLGDIGSGMMALSQGALTIGVNYLQADDEQRGEMTLVAEAFAPTAGQNSVSAHQQAADQQRSATEAAREAEVAETAADHPLPTPTDPTPQADTTALDPSGYQAEVQAHEEAYGQDESKYDGQQVAEGEERPNRWDPVSRWLDDQLRQ